MKGLLIKDFKLMMGQKNFFVTIVVIAIGMSIFTEDSSFIVGYMTFVGSLFTLSTISYDEFDNGNAFLFTLPITRKTYALEKYEFGLIVGGVSWLFAVILVVVCGIVRDSFVVKETIMTALFVLPVLLITLAIMLPFQFKFGGEKSRIVIIGVVGLMLLIALAVVKIADFFHIDLVKTFHNLPVMSTGMLIVTVLGIAIAVLLLSLKISIAIMVKKEF